MLINLLILALAATSAAPPLSPQAATQRAGEAYGLCVATAAREHARTTGDMDAIMARGLGACVAEGEAARRSYFVYLRSIGAAMSDEQYERMMADGMAQLRRRIAGCLETERLNRADGGRRMC